MRLGLVLLPEPSFSEACVRYADALARDRRARVRVGPDALPHVSLLHVETDEDPAAVWRDARAVLEPSYAMDFLALGLLRYDTPYHAPPAPPGTMAWLIVPASPALRRAEERALACGFAQRAPVTTSNGDEFQPHVTLAIWDDEIGPGAFALPRDVVGRTGVLGRLALGIIGPNGTYTRTLFAA